MKKVFTLIMMAFLLWISIADAGAQNNLSLNSGHVSEKWLPKNYLKYGMTEGLTRDRVEETVMEKSPQFTAGKTAIGFVLYDGNHTTFKGLGSFDLNNPSALNCYKGHQFYASGGAFYDGYLYATMYRIHQNQIIKMGFFRIKPETGVSYRISEYDDYPYLFADATYDYTTEKMYFICDKSSTESSLGIVSTVNGSMNIVKNLGRIFYTLSTDRAGRLLGVDKGGVLCQIDKNSGIVSEIGSTGILPGYMQSMACDYDNDIMYWAATKENTSGSFEVINTNTGQASNIGVVGNDGQISCLHIPFRAAQIGIPDRITSLTITPGVSGALNALLSFTTPLKTAQGENLGEITKVEILRNMKVIKTFETPVPGKSLTYTDEVTKDSIYQYRVVAFNSIGKGLPVDTVLYIGQDTPLPPANIILTNNENKGILNWDAPAKGLNGGYVDAATLTYQITRLPEETVIADQVSGTSFTDESIMALNRYSYSITARNNAGVSKAAVSNIVYLGNPYTIPYTCGFEDKTIFNSWEVIDGNNDKRTWEYGYSDFLARYYPGTDHCGDDWFISPAISLSAGQKYRLRFKLHKEGSTAIESLKVFYGNGSGISGQTTELADYPEITSNEVEMKTLEFTPGTDGAYNFSFYCYSKPNQFFLTVSDIIVETMLTNDLKAVSISGNTYPMINKTYNYKVPVLNRGANAQDSYKVQLIDGENNILAEKSMDSVILPDSTEVVVISYAPSTVDNLQLRAKVILENDEDQANNITAPLSVEVQPENDYELATIIDGDKKDRIMPFDFYYKSSVNQSIYTADEILLGDGLIKSITYYYHNTSKKEVFKPVKVYMACTSREHLGDGWIPKEEMTLVFDDSIKINTGEGELEICLSEPFIYNKKNLCIMTERPLDKEYFNNVNFILAERNTGRSLTFSSDSKVFDYTQKGTVKNMVPNLKMRLQTNGEGKLSGVVKNAAGEQVEGVNITIAGTEINTVTDHSGRYDFSYVPNGVHTIKATLHGYEDYVRKEVEIMIQTSVTLDITMNVLPVYSVGGMVKDKDGRGIKEAVIQISGYDQYRLTTDENGRFIIPEVYKAGSYIIKVNKRGMHGYSEEFSVDNEDKTFADIILADVVNPPTRLVAAEDEGEMTLIYKAPSDQSTFRYDSGVSEGGLGIKGGTANTVMGSVHRQPAELTGMSWYTEGAETAGGPHKTVNVFVFDLDANGHPTPGILFNKMGVSNKDNEWTVFQFPDTINAPRGFMLALSYEGFLGIGHDSGTDPEWPFMEKCNYFTGDYTSGVFNLMGPGGQEEMVYNFLIRAEGYLLAGEPAASTIAAPSVQMQPDAAALTRVSYAIWRLPADAQEDESRWSLLTEENISGTHFTDQAWNSIDGGEYKYAVKSVYAGEVMSEPSFSNVVTKTKTVTVGITKPEHGTLEVFHDNVLIGNNTKVTPGSLLRINAIPDENYVLGDIIVNGDAITGNEITVGQDIVITAVFNFLDNIRDVTDYGYRIYPNPVKDKLYVDFEYTWIKIADVSGNTVLQTGKVDAVDVSALPQGVYLVQIYKDGGYLSGKIMK